MVSNLYPKCVSFVIVWKQIRFIDSQHKLQHLDLNSSLTGKETVLYLARWDEEGLLVHPHHQGRRVRCGVAGCSWMSGRCGMAGQGGIRSRCGVAGWDGAN